MNWLLVIDAAILTLALAGLLLFSRSRERFSKQELSSQLGEFRASFGEELAKLRIDAGLSLADEDEESKGRASRPEPVWRRADRELLSKTNGLEAKWLESR